jgi:hypothetical protein
MSEKTEGAITNEQSRDADNIGYTRHRTINKPQIHNTTQKAKTMNLGAIEGKAVPASYKTPAMLIIYI